MKKLILGLAFLLPIASDSALADLITFDDLPRPGGIPLTNGYHGFNYSNLDYINTIPLPGTGYRTGTVSPHNVAYNGYGNPASLTSAGGTAFTLDSFYLTAAWNDDLDVTVTASRLGVVLDTTTLIVSTDGPTLETLNWTGIDTLQFSAFGGTPHPHAAGSGTNFVLDNLAIDESASSPTPEPQTLVLVGSGALAALGAARRRLRV